MLVDRSEIDKAKKRIGDKAADAIARILNLEDFDVRNKRACCPFHHEKTASFIYNPKNYTYHCFGCGVTVDIIDAYMHAGMTYGQALKETFALAGRDYPLGQLGVKDKRDYRYPQMPPVNVPEHAYEYLSKRKISKETIDRVGIKEDEQGNIAFCYYDTNDVLKTVKYRPARTVKHGENKTWCQKNADTEPLLFNMNRVNACNPLVICEGEIDCMSLIEAGITNAVSVPFGAGNLHWIDHNFEWLEQFDSIVFCGDNDKPGITMVKEAISRLGSWRCKVADLPNTFEDNDGNEWPVKDANEVLRAFGAQALRDAIHNAKDTPVASVVDFSDIEDVDINEIDGINIGLYELDKYLLRLFYGTFNIVSGTPGSGKTSFLYQIICNAVDQGVNCWVYSRELSTWLSRGWMLNIWAGPRHVSSGVDMQTGAIITSITKTVKDAISEKYKGRLSFYRDDYPNDYKSLLQAMVDSRRKYGSKVFLIDNLMTVDLGGSDDNKNERQTMFVNELIQFAVKYDACVILVAHPRKMLNSQADIDIYDISGSSNIINLAHRAIGLRRVSKAEKEGTPSKKGDGWDKPPVKYDVVVSITKDRLRGNAGQTINIYYDKISRRFYTNPSEYGKQYSWDTAKYAEDIIYPHQEDIEQEIEVFGEVSRVE